MRPTRTQPARSTVSLTGDGIKYLMRTHQWTIDTLARKLGITQKRMREIRTTGLTHRHAVGDWLEVMTGQGPEEITHPWTRPPRTPADDVKGPL